MGRPPLSLGTMGEIRCYVQGSGRYRAVANYRDFDGVTRRVERTGRTKSAARSRLKEACRDRGRVDAYADITPDTKVQAVAELWYREIEFAVEAGDRSPGTAQTYRDRLDKQVIPAVGALRLREVTVSRVDALLKIVREKHGVGVAKLTRTVLSGVLGLAARHDALTGNPVRDAAAIRTPQKTRAALTLEEVWDLRARLAADSQALAWDLPDFADMMLATGLRIGETSAITWAALDLDAELVEVRGTVIRIKGKGLVIKLKPKSKAGWRTIELPTWTVTMLRKRLAEYEPNQWDAVFTSPTGRLRDPSNTQGDLRAVFDRAGYPEITSHTFRRTVATLMDQAGLSARAAADQLGHAKVSMTTDRYYGRGIRSTGAAQVLEALDQRPEDRSDVRPGIRNDEQNGDEKCG
jgi:integrase